MKTENIRTCTVEEVERLVEPLRGELVEEARRYRADLSPIETGIEPKLPLLDDVKAVLFDIYGTLLISAAGEVGSAVETFGEDPPTYADELREESAGTGALSGSEEVHSGGSGAFPDSGGDEESETTVFAEVLRKTGFPPSPGAAGRAQELYYEGIQRIHELLKSRGVAQPEVNIVEVWLRILEQLREEEFVRDSRDLCATAVRAAFYFEIHANVVSPMPGAAEILQGLAGRGFTLGIVSNAQFYTPLVIEALLGGAVGELGFSEELCIWSWKLREAKPSPRLFVDALERLRAGYGIGPGEVLYVGNDMRNDIRPSKELGCATALFAGDRRSLRLRRDDPSMGGVEPEARITRLEQLMTVVPERRGGDA